jgi:hypothetical protein
MALVTGRRASSSGQTTSYGGDAQIVATRGEIDRVIAELNGLEAWLRGQIELQDFAIEPLLRVRLALELPPILEKLGRIRDACGHAADSYFEAETEISRELRESPDIPIAKIASGLTEVGAVFGVLGETKISANLVGVESSIAAPTSVGTLASRLAQVIDLAGGSTGVESGWLRIEKFREPAKPIGADAGFVEVGEARYVVYVPGTQNWAARPGINPFDLTSNLSAISKTGFAGSERAVLEAMKQAGIGPDSKVLLVGHSQGGLVAANISTRFAGSRVLTFGAPLGLLASELKAPALAVEHPKDPVPMLDGKPNPFKTNWVTVRQDFEASSPLAQHEMSGYLDTARQIDGQPANPGLEKMRRELAGFAGTGKGSGTGQGASVGQAYLFELARVP